MTSSWLHPLKGWSLLKTRGGSWCAGLDRALAPLQLDVCQANWPGVPAQVEAVVCANMIHIAPWASCTGLAQGAARHLSARGLLIFPDRGARRRQADAGDAGAAPTIARFSTRPPWPSWP
ncbi:MAG: DUF938 domain-containing protein [Burkholderiales bacterium]|nr:DUF938 domain-containing protein [Burkholderiales bacterium]MDE2394222.1 DUF938 domain-containing protein [Burkholderiales bacterium]MDE2454001.1 DUF938 domain-containing protein [Burkholderiales bacterium]